MLTTSFPATITTERLELRRWRPVHAQSLKAALDASVRHLASWIPWRIAEPAPVEALERRLAQHASDFDAGKEWIYAIFEPGDDVVLGAVGMYPRDATTRAMYPNADRLELGYWLHIDATGRGYATEATRAMLPLGESLDGIRHFEIRCDPRNAPSAAVPRRLGFTHDSTEIHPPKVPTDVANETMIWVRRVER